MNYTNTTLVSDIGSIRSANPNMSIPEGADLSDIGWYRLIDLPAPAYDPATQRIEQTSPQEVDGIWTLGWTVIDLTPEEIEAKYKATVPQSVSIRQACQALEAAGLLDDIEAAIATAPRTVQIDWQRTTSVDRNWPTLLAVQSQMGLTDAQIDQLFITASQL